MSSLESTDFSALEQEVRKAIRESLSVLREQGSCRHLAGYALLTDDDLRTLLYAAIDSEAGALASDPDLLFSPTEWPIADRDLVEPSRSLQRGADNAVDFDGYVDGAFACLVSALFSLRASGDFDQSVFLIVASTDPGPHLRRLEEGAAELLNSPSVVRRRQAFLRKWGAES